MNKQTIFSVTLFDSTYTGDLESIIKGCKNIYQKQPSVKHSNNHGYQSTDDYICTDSCNQSWIGYVKRV